MLLQQWRVFADQYYRLTSRGDIDAELCKVCTLALSTGDQYKAVLDRKALQGRPGRAEADLRRALEWALAATDATLLVCGSIYLVGRVRGLLRERFGVPKPL